MTKKNTLTVIFIVCCVISIFGIAIFSTYYNEINEFGKAVSGVDNIEDKESMFAKRPTIELAFSLMAKYKHVESIKNNEKVEFYGREAINLGANNILCGFFVNIWLASVYHEKGDNHNACIFFNKATELQNVGKNNILSEELLEVVPFV